MSIAASGCRALLCAGGSVAQPARGTTSAGPSGLRPTALGDGRAQTWEGIGGRRTLLVSAPSGSSSRPARGTNSSDEGDDDEEEDGDDIPPAEQRTKVINMVEIVLAEKEHLVRRFGRIKEGRFPWQI
jgi:hypothetical protein